MTQHPEVVATNLGWMAFWILLVGFILIAGRRWARLQHLRETMIGQWKAALVIAVLFWLSMGLGGRGFLNPFAAAVFCQALIGLTLAHDVPGHDPLPVVRSIARREKVLRMIGLTLGAILLLVVITFLLGNVGMSIVQQMFHETSHSSEAMNTLPASKAQVFFLLLAGAGIAEETVYRLVLVPLFWRMTQRRWLAVLLSAAAFAAYHLTPLDGMYRIFWQFPVSQFFASFLIGIVWAIAYSRRGYETVVLAHTLGDWIPFMLFL